MGGLLAVPAKLFLVIYNVLDRASFFWLSYSISYVYLSILERMRKKKFVEYDFTVDGQPEKTGFFIPQIEYVLDRPQKSPALDKKADDAFIFGVNSNTDGLAVHISRQANGKVSCSLLLRFADGREYVLPKEDLVQAENSEEFTFGSSRLKLQCLLPMRKWRIFFNGILREISSHNDALHPKYKHVSFTFIFTASSDVFCFESEMSKALLAFHASLSARQFSTFPLYTLTRLQEVLNGYEQSGMILGTFKIENEEEQELYLWGNRGRYMGETRSLGKGNFVQIYGNFQNGAIIHIGILNVDNVLFKFTYGFVMRSDGFIHPIETLSRGSAELFHGQYSFLFFCGGVHYQLVITEPDAGSDFRKEFIGTGSVKFSDLILNGWPGRGFVFKGTIDGTKSKAAPHFAMPDLYKKQKPLITSFGEMSCQDSSLTGGKGSSLGKLYSLSLEVQGMKRLRQSPSFQVSKGFVITTESYKLFIEGELNETLEKFQREVWAKPEGGSKNLCDKMVEKVLKSKIPFRIIQCVKDNVRKVFSTDHAKKRFAVRSSATGEDTEQMSAAGQMETFLGLKSIDEVLEAVKKCWASQFTFQAVEYKRRYGQLLNTPMAVVVQEMVPCDVAGVAFTCDPLTGNPRYISITANYGLGESVVSASAEPDTVVLKRHIDNKLDLHAKEIGKKASKVVMTGESGVEHLDTDVDTSISCLSDEMSLKLGHIAVKLEETFGSPRDLEWGIIGKDIYLFQARPVTSIDMDTDFETRHIFDTYMRLENEYFSKANVGEVLPGATSLLGYDYMDKIMNTAYLRQRWVRWDGAALPEVPYFCKRMCTIYRHCFICLLDGFLRLEDDNQDLTKAFMIAVYGREIGDDDLAHFATERHKAFGKKEGSHLIYTVYTTLIMYISGFLNKRLAKEIDEFELPVNHKNTPTEILTQIANNFQVCSEAMNSHMNCSVSSSFWNMDMLKLLAEAKGAWDHEVYSDFGYLLSSCTKLESADIPASIQKLGVVIARCISAEKFKQMDSAEALKWLQTTNSEAGKVFKQFLTKHGHRCLKEFDVMMEPWAMNPLPLVKMLQNFISFDAKENLEKDVLQFSSIVSNLKISLNATHKIKLYWYLMNGRRGVREREFAKSALIKSYHKFRKAFHCLAEVMVREGYLPNKNLLFFLAIDEIRQLIKTRSPRLVASAFKRSKCHDELDQLIFDEICSGVPKPINAGNATSYPSGGFSMTGIPVSQGIVKATARVAMNLEEAASIQKGDVLITYATDIGWSPYFPLLSGVVTELGGLISHGAVVAREYGLPCIVGLQGATRAFKSGDLVVLDGNKGTLQKIETESTEEQNP